MSETSTLEAEPSLATPSDVADESSVEKFLHEHREQLKDLIKDSKKYRALYESGMQKEREGRKLTIKETIACLAYTHYKGKDPSNNIPDKHVEPREIIALRHRKAIFDEFFDLLETVLDRDWPEKGILNYEDKEVRVLGKTKGEVQKVVRANKQRIEKDFLLKQKRCLEELKTIRDWVSKRVPFIGRKQLHDMEEAEKSMGSGGSGRASSGGDESEVDAILKKFGY